METRPLTSRAHPQCAQFHGATVGCHGQPVIASSNTSHRHLHPSCYQHDVMPSEAEEELGSHDSLLEYINSMLMDETFEDSSWQQLLAISNGTDRSGGLDVLSGKSLSSSLSPLNERYERIFRGFHEILDGQQPHAQSFPPFVDANAASYELVVDGLWNDLEEVTPEGCPWQQPEKGGDADASTYNQASTYTIELEQDAIISSMMVHDKAKAHAHGTPLDQHIANTQHIELPIIVEASPNVHNNNELPIDTGVGQFHAHVNGPRSSMRGNLKKVVEAGDVSLVRNADLPAELYAQLFDEWPLHTSKASTSFGGGAASGRQRGGSKENAGLTNPIDLKALLLTSAKAAGEGNMKRATEILQQIQQLGATPCGTGLERVVHYFSEALRVRLSGMGSTFYKAVASTAQPPSPLMMIKVYKMVFEVCPYVKIGYHFANQHILKVASGASRLHIVDYGILYGFQWPCLIYALAHRREGPPFIRITGIEFPANPADINPTATTEGTSCRLSEYAKTYNVPFQYHAVSASKWEDIDPSSLQISHDEVLVLNSFNRLSHLHDDSMVYPSPRDQLLKQMRDLNPQLLVIGSVNATHSSPFFAPRFKEAFHYYYNMFDALHTTLSNESAERVVFERELMGQAILNVVACEGTDRTEIPENYRQWQARIKRAGFQQLPIIPSVMSKAQNIMKSYHKDFSLLDDSNLWMLLGWRGRCMQALSAWEPTW